MSRVHAVTSALSRALAAAIIAPIKLYQRFISPMRPATCRFYPTCSAYAVTALRMHGPLVGLWLAARRLGRCHPWTRGGVDHVPPRGQVRSTPRPYDPREADREVMSAVNPDDAAVPQSPHRTTRWSGSTMGASFLSPRTIPRPPSTPPSSSTRRQGA